MENKAIELLEAGQVDEALILLKQMEESEDLLEQYVAKDIYYQFGFYDEGIQHVSNMLKFAPNDGELLVALAAMYIDIEEDGQAIELLLEVQDDDPFYLSSLLMLADLYFVQGLFEVSEVKLFDAKKIDPDEILIDFALAELFFSTGEYHRAIPFYEKVNEKEDVIDHISITERLAECYGTLGRYEEAFSLYEKIESNDPNILFKHGYMAKQVGRNQIAIQKWEALLDLDPAYFSVYPELATVYEDENNTEDALRILQLSLTQNTFNKEVYLKMARLYYKQQGIGDAIAYAKEAIALDYDYKEAILFLVKLYEIQDEDEAIIELLLEVKATESEDGDYDWELAKAYERSEMYKEANLHFDKAYDTLQYQADFLLEYGQFLVEEGKIEQALNVLKQYIILEPEDEETIRFIDRISFSNE